MYYVYIYLDIYLLLYKQFFAEFEDQYTIRMRVKTRRNPGSIRFH